MPTKTKHPKKSDIKKLKPVELRKEKKKELKKSAETKKEEKKVEETQKTSEFKETILEDKKDFSLNAPASSNERSVDNLEEFASALPSNREEKRPENPYSASTLYGNSSYSANNNYDFSGTYNAKNLNEEPSLEHHHEVVSPFVSTRSINSQTDYESRQKENINKGLESTRQEIEESHFNPRQRRSRRVQ